MLILTRRLGESIMLGDDITITIVGNNRGQIRIGIEAPKTIPIWREELYLKKGEKNGHKVERENG